MMLSLFVPATLISLGTQTVRADELLDQVLASHEAAQETLRTGEGNYVLEFTQHLSGDWSSREHALRGGDRANQLKAIEIMREKSRIDFDNGTLRAKGRWWFSGEKYRFDRSPLPLKEDEYGLPIVSVAAGRYTFDGQAMIRANHKAAIGLDMWQARLQSPEPVNTTVESRLVRGLPVDIRSLQHPDDQPLRAYVDRLVRTGNEATAVEKDGLIEIAFRGRDDDGRTQITLDSRQAFSIVRTTAYKGDVQYLDFSAQYEEISGYWFLKQVSLHRVRGGLSGGENVIDIRLAVENAKLGHDIDDSVFTLAGLGLPEGTGVTDNRVKPAMSFRYGSAPASDLDALVSKITEKGLATSLPTSPQGNRPDLTGETDTSAQVRTTAGQTQRSGHPAWIVGTLATLAMLLLGIGIMYLRRKKQ